jgi:hypothetical protein
MVGAALFRLGKAILLDVIEFLNLRGKVGLLFIAPFVPPSMSLISPPSPHVHEPQAANTELVTEDGYTALGYASACGHTNIVKALLKAGANANVGHKNAIALAVENGRTDIMQMLLDSMIVRIENICDSKTIVEKRDCISRGLMFTS